MYEIVKKENQMDAVIIQIMQSCVLFWGQGGRRQGKLQWSNSSSCQCSLRLVSPLKRFVFFVLEAESSGEEDWGGGGGRETPIDLNGNKIWSNYYYYYNSPHFARHCTYICVKDTYMLKWG